MAQLLFYEKPVALNRTAHAKLRVAPNTDFKFAANTNSVILTGIEFIEASKEYPIVFAKLGDNSFVPAALLGLENTRNLFIGADGKWDARYIPAFVRRYPFVLAEGADKELAVCVDEAYAGLGENDGVALFDHKGENTPFLQQTLDFLSNYRTQHTLTRQFTARLNELGLLMLMNAKAELVDGSSYLMSGFYIVDEKKLLEFNPKKVYDAFKSGQLAWIYAHLFSLSNMSRLVDRMARKN